MALAARYYFGFAEFSGINAVRGFEVCAIVAPRIGSFRGVL